MGESIITERHGPTLTVFEAQLQQEKKNSAQIHFSMNDVIVNEPHQTQRAGSSLNINNFNFDEELKEQSNGESSRGALLSESN